MGRPAGYRLWAKGMKNEIAVSNLIFLIIVDYL